MLHTESLGIRFQGDVCAHSYTRKSKVLLFQKTPNIFFLNMDLLKWLSAYNSLMIPSDLQMEVQIPKHGIQNTVLLTLNSALS